METLEVLNEVLAGKRLSERSKANYRAVFRSLAQMHKDFPSRSVEVNKWLVSLEGFADTTVRLWFSILREACKYMEANYDLPNPCKAIDALKVQKKRRRYFTAGEIARVLQACRGEFELALIMTLVDSSCRVGGLANLKGSGVGDGWINVKEKTGARRYRLDRRICVMLRRLAGDDDGLVFGLSSSALSMRVIRICKRAGLSGKKLGPHTLRHSSASLVASETGNVMAVKALLQHDNIHTSMVYIHDVEEEIQQRISPLRLVADRVNYHGGKVGAEQLALTDGHPGDSPNALVTVQGEIVEGEVEDDGNDGIDELLLEMFPEVGRDVEIRPRLGKEDLELIRKGFLALAGDGEYSREVGQASRLMKRMLRKVG